MFLKYKSSNPVFSTSLWKEKTNTNYKMTVLGIFLKSFFCICLLSIATAFIWKLYAQGEPIKWYTTGGMLGAIILSILIAIKQEWAKFLVPIYAIAKGLFLGGFSVYIHKQYPYYPFQAVGITIIVFLIMIVLYKTRIIKLTKRLRSTIIVATITIMTVYIITWILSFFGVNVSFIWGNNWFALGFNVFAALTASFALLIDIDFIDRYKNKASKEKEWIATWGLLVTLIWLYIEVLRLMKRLAIR